MEIYGTPGGYAGTLTRRYRLRAGAAAAAAVAAVAVSWPAAHVALWMAAVNWAGAAVAAVAASNWWNQAKRAAVGARAERLTVTALRRAGWNGTVFCGLMVGGGGDADLICVSVDGRVRVGEVKTVKGTLSVSGTSLASNGRRLTRQPYPQVRRQAAALARRNISAAPFIVASEARMPAGRTRAGDIDVVNAAGLPGLLAADPGPFNPKADAALRALAERQQLARRSVG